MGKKKKKTAGEKLECWYCAREFDDEVTLLRHQRQKHFRCNDCNKQLNTINGLVAHAQAVHKETIRRVPNAISDRDDINISVVGMEGYPETEETEPEAKKGKTDTPAIATPLVPAAVPPTPYAAPYPYAAPVGPYAAPPHAAFPYAVPPPPGIHPPGIHPPPGMHPPGIHPPGIHPPGIHPPGIHPPGIHPPGIHPPSGMHPPPHAAFPYAHPPPPFPPPPFAHGPHGPKPPFPIPPPGAHPHIPPPFAHAPPPQSHLQSHPPQSQPPQSQPPQSQPPQSQPQATSSKPPGGPEMRMIYADEHLSMEEKRAALPKYSYDAATLSAQRAQLDRSIDSRLSSLR